MCAIRAEREGRGRESQAESSLRTEPIWALNPRSRDHDPSQSQELGTWLTERPRRPRREGFVLGNFLFSCLPCAPAGTQSAADGDASPEHCGRALQLAAFLGTESLPFRNHLYARIWWSENRRTGTHHVYFVLESCNWRLTHEMAKHCCLAS